VTATLRKSHVERGVRLEWFTVAYNSLEAVASLVAGWLAGSIALVGFGLDSVIEVTSGAALLWRLHLDSNSRKRETAEQTALKIVGICFLALAVYVSWESLGSLFERKAPERTILGIVIATVSVIVMPLLAKAKRRVAGEIGSAALAADSKQTSLCSYLSFILLAGLGLNAAFGWWWADPTAGLLMVPIIACEGIDALRGKQCCDGCHG
jgi:divalent metal cation (Fe/Co/Zn/Cd) transporter